MNNFLKILFMGTPSFAVKILDTINNNYLVAGVVTQPDKPQGRKYVLTPSPVKKYAIENQLAVYQPSTLKNESFKTNLSEIDPDIIIVVAYGMILPEYVLKYPKFGCINVHASLLPKYRGAAPIQRAIINGEKYTGITTMLMDKGLDTGDILEQEKIAIGDNDDFETVSNNLASIASSLILSTIEKRIKNVLNPISQDNSESTYAEKITNDECMIDFNKSNFEVHNLIRALSPDPGAYTFFNGKRIKIIKSAIGDSCQCSDSGKVVFTNRNKITVSCNNGTVDIYEVIPEGKKRMTVKEFLNGAKIKQGDLFGQ